MAILLNLVKCIYSIHHYAYIIVWPLVSQAELASIQHIHYCWPLVSQAELASIQNIQNLAVQSLMSHAELTSVQCTGYTKCRHLALLASRQS